jgi:pyruvate dehydrogenase E2 component (dihydrolipoamide acetyltransferase)
MAQQITVPDLGDFKDVEVIDVLVKAGDRIDVDTPLLTLETEKATMDVPSAEAGVVSEVAVKKGDRVSKGSVIAVLEPEAVSPAGPTPPGFPSGHGSRSAVSQKQAQPAAAQKTTPAAQDVRMPRTQGSAGAAPQGEGAENPPVDEARLVSKAEDRAKEAQRPAAPSEPTANRQPLTASFPAIDEAGFARAHASPSVRKFARELGVDLARVKGTGLKERITPEDVKAWVKQALVSGAPAAGGGALPKIPEVDFAKFGQIEVRPLGRIQKISGPRLQASWLNVPHVWQMDEADITELEDARNKLKGKAAKEGVKLTPLAFILRACVKALHEFPLVNSSLDATGQNLVLKKYVHLGFAADTPNGLVVPVIRDADRKDVYELARDLATLSEKARAGKLSAAEMQGASFTVSSLGGIGGTSFTPIINAPEVAILGVARSSMRPVYQNGQFVPRLILPFTFAYDHRVVDGAGGVRFTTFLAEKLADVRGLLEAVP